MGNCGSKDNTDIQKPQPIAPKTNAPEQRPLKPTKPLKRDVRRRFRPTGDDKVFVAKKERLRMIDDGQHVETTINKDDKSYQPNFFKVSQKKTTEKIATNKENGKKSF